MNTKIIGMFISAASLAALVACSSNAPANTSATTPTEQAAGSVQKPAAVAITVDDVVNKLKDADLEAESPTKIAKNEVGAAPTIFTEGRRILVPSLGEDNGGRVFIFENEADMKTMKSYYDELGKSSGLAFSWTAGKGNVLLQMNGDMKEETFDKYKKVIESL